MTLDKRIQRVRLIGEICREGLGRRIQRRNRRSMMRKSVRRKRRRTKRGRRGRKRRTRNRRTGWKLEEREGEKNGKKEMKGMGKRKNRKTGR